MVQRRVGTSLEWVKSAVVVFVVAGNDGHYCCRCHCVRVMRGNGLAAGMMMMMLRVSLCCSHYNNVVAAVVHEKRRY